MMYLSIASSGFCTGATPTQTVGQNSANFICGFYACCLTHEVSDCGDFFHLLEINLIYKIPLYLVKQIYLSQINPVMIFRFFVCFSAIKIFIPQSCRNKVASTLL
jgi:hypothetical protein